MRRWCAALVLVALLGAACSSSPDVDAASSGTTGATDGTTPVEPDGSKANGPPRPGSTKDARTEPGKGEERPVGVPTSGPAANNTMPLAVRLSTLCARPGQEMMAYIETRPEAKLGFAVAYSGKTPPDFTPGTVPADSDGRFTWTWVVKSAATEGDAIFSVVASKNGKGASYNQWFRISLSC